jgi:hypothetical protein
MTIPPEILYRLIENNLLVNPLFRVPPLVIDRKHERSRKQHTLVLLGILMINQLLESTTEYFKVWHLTTCFIPGLNEIKRHSLTNTKTTITGIDDDVMSAEKIC